MAVTTGISGANTKLCIKEETAWGVVPTGTWEQIPFISATIGVRDDTTNTPVLGYGRDPQRVERDGVTIAGDIVMPADLTAVGFFLKGLLGAAADTGTTDVSHVFKSGTFNQPSFALEFQHPDAGPGTPSFRTIRGVLVNTAQIRLGGRGARPQISFGFLGIDEDFDNVSNAGTPTVILPTWFEGRKTVLTKDGTALAKITDLTVNLSNNWDVATAIGGGGVIGLADPGMFACDGSLTARFNDLTLYALAQAGTLFDLAFGWTTDVTHSLIFELDQAELVRQGTPVAGPGPVTASYNVMASKDFTEGQALHVTLNNQRATY